MNELIEQCTRNKNFLSIKGGLLKIENGLSLPTSLKEQLIVNKKSVIEVLKMDLKAKQRGFLIGISGEVYSCPISRTSEIFLEKLKGEWIGWRESFDKDTGKSKSSKVIVKANTFDYALQEIEGYLNFINDKKVVKQ